MKCVSLVISLNISKSNNNEMSYQDINLFLMKPPGHAGKYAACEIISHLICLGNEKYCRKNAVDVEDQEYKFFPF